MAIRYILTWIAILLVCLILYALIEFLIIKHNGTYVPAPDIPRTPYTSGAGPKLTYVVMGDSTSIGQGADYAFSYAKTSTEHLSKKYEVTLINVGVSGARVDDVLQEQIATVKDLSPDIVLIGVGANDTTHFTNLNRLATSLQQIINELRNLNPGVRIILTRSPALDSVSRFPLLSKYVLRLRTEQVNKVFDAVITKNNVTPALIAEKTREAYLADPTLTSADNFHPNERGYALWTPIINDSIDTALRSK